MHRWIFRTAAAAVLVLSLPFAGHGQATGPASDLGARLRERFDVVPLQQGVALVPRESGSAVRLVQIEGGVVAVDGQPLTGAQLRERLGADADLVVQASYLTPQQQRGLADAAGTPPGGGAAAEPAGAIERSEVRRQDVFRFGDELTIGRNERVEGDVVLFGGAATVDGEVTGDLFVFGGPARLGPDAIVRGDVSVVGGPLDRAPGAQVLGDVNEVGGRRGGAFRPRWMMSQMFGPFVSRLGSLAATILRLTVVLLVGLVVIAFGRGATEEVAARTAATPLRSGLIGLLAQVLVLPVLILTCVVLVVSIVGIPLLALVPFALLLLMLVMLVGFVGLAYQMGRMLASRFGRPNAGPYGAFAVGVIAVGALTLLGKLGALAGGFLLAPVTAVGYVVEYVAWTAGFGAALLYWYETQTRFGSRRTPAPVAPAAAPDET